MHSQYLIYIPYLLEYKNITLKKFNKSHDRFIIINDKNIYHFGVSLKNLGKKRETVRKKE